MKRMEFVNLGVLAAGILVSFTVWPQSESKDCTAAHKVVSLTPKPRFTTKHKTTKKLWWGQRFVDHLQQIDNSNGAFDLVFCGDSITHNWERRPVKEYMQITNRYSVLNLGFGGDGVEHLLWRLENGEMDGYKAKCVMLMIGTNGLDAPENKAAGIRKVLDLIEKKQPEATILLLPIFPRGDGPNDVRRLANDKVNQIIRSYADGQRVIWVDFTEKFLDENGDTLWIMPDRLHPNVKGHQLWMDAVMPYFLKIVGK